jgi:hypothetical protein
MSAGDRSRGELQPGAAGLERHLGRWRWRQGLPAGFIIASLLLNGTPNALALEESSSGVRPVSHQTEELEHTVIVGVGGAAELELGNAGLHPGLNVFIEYEAIENWLELELDVSLLAAEGGLEIPVDLLIKKPFRLTRHLELMIGIGPQIVRVSGTEKNGTFIGGEAVLDFMFWPTRHVGLWLEPNYAFVFRNGVSHSVGTTGGVIFGW